MVKILNLNSLIVNLKSLIGMVPFQVFSADLLVADGSPCNPDVGNDKGDEQRYIAHGRQGKMRGRGLADGQR